MKKLKHLSPRQALLNLLSTHPHLAQNSIQIVARGLKPQEAIGNPERSDFPLLTGKEVLVQAEMEGAVGQAFTSDPLSYRGTIQNIASLPAERPGQEALVIATLNAVSAKLGLTDHTIHCRDQEPEVCGEHISQAIIDRYGQCRVGIIGYQPAILEHCVRRFGEQNVHITDLNPDNIGQIRFGVEVWDGALKTRKLIDNSDVVLVTGTVLVNGTFEVISEVLGATPYYFFGTTAAAMAALNQLPRICPLSK